MTRFSQGERPCLRGLYSALQVTHEVKQRGRIFWGNRLLMKRLSAFSGFRLFHSQILCLVVAGAACTQPKPIPAGDNPTPTDVARVNDQMLRVEEFEQYLKDEGLNSERIEERRVGVQRLIRQKVLAQEARKAGFAATVAEAREIGWVSSSGGTASNSEYSLQQILDYLVIQKLLLDRLQAGQAIELRTLLLHYERNMAAYEVNEQYRVLEILVQDRAEAERIRGELRAGDFRQFREMANARSTGVGAEWGGDLGLFQRGELPPRFEEVVFSLKVGELSEVFQSELGHHVFTIEELIPRHAQKFYEVQDQIFEQLVAEQEREGLELIVNQMMQSASIEIFDPNLNRDWRERDAQLP